MIDKTYTELRERVTNEKYLKFLDLYPTTKMITKTAEAMGLDRNTIHYWLAKDEDFFNTFSALKKNMEAELEEKYMQTIEDVVDSDKTQPQSRLLGSFFMLKALNPRYKDKVDNTINIGEIVLKGFINPNEVIEIPPKDVKEITGGSND